MWICFWYLLTKQYRTVTHYLRPGNLQNRLIMLVFFFFFILKASLVDLHWTSHTALEKVVWLHRCHSSPNVSVFQSKSCEICFILDSSLRPLMLDVENCPPSSFWRQNTVQGSNLLVFLFSKLSWRWFVAGINDIQKGHKTRKLLRFWLCWTLVTNGTQVSPTAHSFTKALIADFNLNDVKCVPCLWIQRLFLQVAWSLSIQDSECQEWNVMLGHQRSNYLLVTWLQVGEVKFVFKTAFRESRKWLLPCGHEIILL